LNAQIDAFVHVVDVLSANGCSDITLIGLDFRTHSPQKLTRGAGHSVGTWISTQVLKQRPDLVNKVIMVTPTVSQLR